ncbi:MAG TPA: LutB/LldF family L-lactate oxidation iron-sulfur protein [Pyrinomonadaceae bacterium]|nr:LutB/LldF family L-lactate oxidation iron-sulfur protein [Pyrinomonadaceae bacterium]
MNHLSSETFGENAKAALANAQLRGALRHATSLFGKRRLEAARSLSNWEDLRTEARAIKDDVLLHLDRYLETFVANAEKRGAVVHWAIDAAEANAIICGLARERNARTVVKSKSMTTEETHLNDALEAAGMQVVETDLGEYIVQLAGETPSHILAPAIHKTKGQIAELFTATLGMPPTDDVAKLTSTARATLRDRFAAADVGISGVNFGIAETGTIVIIENEGNIRLTTSLPRTHIAVMGIEKVLPRFADLDTFLKLLPRSGAGQRMSAYQSFITGTKRNATDEGPDELHIVILDNGRSRMLAHPVTRQSLACIRCGACLNACPVYQQIGGHAYGSVYPGPIGAVITPQLIGIEKTAQLPYASSLCGACREVCPVKIDIPQLLLHLRSEIAASPKGDARERLAFKLWAKVMMSPTLYKMGALAGRMMQRVMPLSRAWTSGRDLRPIERQSFRDQWKSKLSNG